METIEQEEKQQQEKQFKSYYVVWKQVEGADIFQGDIV